MGKKPLIAIGKEARWTPIAWLNATKRKILPCWELNPGCPPHSPSLY
jgi:hypothetical protein